MAFSIQQAMDEFFNNSGGGGINYGGTGISGGYGSIAGGSTKKGGGSSGSGETKKPEPSAPVQPVPKQFNPSDYKHSKHNNGRESGLQDSWEFYNGTYIDRWGFKSSCDGWIIFESGREFTLPPCPKKILVSHLDWNFLP